MIKKITRKSCFMLMGCLFFSLKSSAMMRIDIGDRSKEEVLQNSYSLGESLIPAKATCVICIDDKKWVSGVALDPWTILTCAYYTIDMEKYFYINFEGDILFNYKSGFESCIKAIPYPSFKLRETEKKSYSLSVKEGQFYMCDAPLERLGDITFEDFENHPIVENYDFLGTDLAIIKLEKPISFPIQYPTILRDDTETESENISKRKLGYGISVGYGPAQYNFQESPPIYAEAEFRFKKHVLSLTLDPFVTKKTGAVLYGDYEGLLINGGNSFISNNAMLKTEGLPVEGDSGGGFFVKINKVYYLAGIFSQTKTFMDPPVNNLEARKGLKSFKQKKFPEFVDVRAYKDWIEEHMGV